MGEFALSGSGCAKFDTYLLPALLGGNAGMNDFIPVRGTTGTCAFTISLPETSGGRIGQPTEEPFALRKRNAEKDVPETGSSSGLPIPANTLPHGAAFEINDLPAMVKYASPSAGMPMPTSTKRDSSRTGSPVAKARAQRHVPLFRRPEPASLYRFFLILSVVVLILALLILAGALTMLLYVRWFSEQAALARAVRKGLKRNEFRLNYQPVFYTKTRKCIGLEAVLHWENVAYGLRGESWYTGKLAASRSTTKLVDFVLSAVERELRSITQGRKLYLMVNLWASCLENGECLRLVKTRIKSFTSSHVVFVIKADDVPEQLESLAQLRQEKIRVALSGVRTTTSLSTSVLPTDFEFVKVDREVMGLDEPERVRTLQEIAAIGRQLDIAVVADGVEGIGQYRAVEDARIELAQGFFLGKAVPAHQLPALFSRLGW
jgi:EAL domain-containing protein (putative c-di-GMP-specific phosphodiesterase class I)